MGKLKAFYFDEIAQADHSFNEPDIPSTCYVLTERDKLTNHIVPIHAYIFRVDAEEALRTLALGQQTFQIPEYLDYAITEVRSS